MRGALDRLFRWFLVRLCLYLALGLLATWTLSMVEGYSWVSEMRHGILPWVSMAVINEVIYRLSPRKRADTPNP
ncbi:hypothetical protein [Actinoallomurus sp. NPDC050550]|uniref:hypothetical protein n=1 Tax=Actinoallomurus sp. NPDC050550 TaxID=3154937 RepID=UPI00340463C3